MAFSAFERIVTGNQLLEQLQDRLESAFKGNLEGSPVDGEGIEVDLGGKTTVRIAHKLGRVPTGWIIVDRVSLSGALDISRSSWDNNFVVLSNPSTLTGKLTLRIF